MLNDTSYNQVIQSHLIIVNWSTMTEDINDKYINNHKSMQALQNKNLILAQNKELSFLI